jgi:tetratricopeptide (TPR) repeat protein
MTTHAEYLPSIRKTAAFAVALTGLLLLTWQIYRPGLNGSFLFDDYVNLNALGDTGPISDWPSFLRYVTSGDADPTGRPLTLLTFLLDAQNWPADPFSFKRTNILLHLLNGALLCWVMLKFGRRAALSESQNCTASLLGTAIWLLHPLFISTTLYIVQREAMLPATFSLCGILFWCIGRDRLDESRIVSAWAWMATGSLLCTLLATLCKANGALLPLLIATAECTVLRRNAPTITAEAMASLRRQRTWLLGMPTLLLLLYLLSQFPAYIHIATDKRPWTVGQRLLSEPRVLMSYLRLLWLPRATSQGVFNDQITVSTGWLTPWTTLPCLLATLTLCGVGWWLRKRSPILAFAILFYFAGQVMESTFVPLELFFEHRNYLPAVFMFWPLAVWLTDKRTRLPRRSLSMIILLIIAALTWSGAQVWGDSHQQALIWARTNPDSARAQAVAASTEMARGDYAAAISRLRIASAKEPNEVQLTLNLVDAECAAGGVSPSTWQLTLFSLRHTANASQAILSWFTDSIQRAKGHTCKGLTLLSIQQALQAVQDNLLYDRESGFRQDFAHISGLLALAEGQPQTALDEFNRALAERPDHGTALEQAAMLGSAGYPIYGLRHLDFAQAQERTMKIGLGMPCLHDWLLSNQGYWQHETAVLRSTLIADSAKQTAKSPSPAG